MKNISTQLAAIALSLLLMPNAVGASASATIAVHAGPSRDHAIVEITSNTQIIQIHRCSQNWCAVSLSTITGWVYEPDLGLPPNALRDHDKLPSAPIRVPAPHPLDRTPAAEPRPLHAPPDRL